MNLESSLKRAAHSIVTNVACSKKLSKILIICGKHNSGFAEYLMTEYHKKNAYPHLWLWDENLLRTKGSVEVEAIMAKLCRQTLSLLENSELVVWLIQFENPEKAKAELGTAVCSFWDNIYEVIKGKPRLYVNLFSAKSMESMGIGYERFLAAFSDAVNVDYEKVKKTGSSIRAGLEGRRLIKVTDPNGTSLSFSIENRRVGTEIGTLEDCFSTGRECEVEIPAGEVYVAPLEDSSCGRLVVDEIRDFGVKKLEMHIENGRIVDLRAEKGEAEFRDFLENAQGNKDIVAEFGMGINHGMKPIGLRICDEKAVGTVHIAIGNNVQLGGINRASIHIDFNLYRPTVMADNDFIMKDGRIAEIPT